MKRRNLYILIGILIIVLAGGYFINRKFSQKDQLLSAEISPIPSVVASPTPSPEEEESPSLQAQEIPESYLIKNFPFQPQAPFAVWDELHDEACEEAAVILVQWWNENKSSILAQRMDEEILKMVDWQVKTWGAHKDLTVKETAELAQEFYGLKLTPKYGIDIETIKKAVSKNQPVIVPTAGRLLGNPYYRQPGPIYHMLVIIGYEGRTIITQDIGTKRGEHYRYNEKILFNAIHDWNGSPEAIEQGQKAMLTLSG